MGVLLLLTYNQMQVLVGEGRGKKASAEVLAGETIPYTCYNDGIITDEVLFTEYLQEFWEKHQLPTKDVRLMIHNKLVATAKFDVPTAKEKEMLAFVQREFYKHEDDEEQIYSYQPIEKKAKEKQTVVIASRISRAELEMYETVFENIGVKLTAIQSALGTLIYHLGMMKELSIGANIVQINDGRQVTNLLYMDGKFNHFNTTRIYEQSGSIGYAVEVARTISNQLQFMKANDLAYEQLRVLLSGFTPEDAEACTESITQMNPDVEVGGLSIERDLLSRMGLVHTDKTENFLYSLEKAEKESRKQANTLNKFVLPIACLAGALAVVTLALGVLNVVTNVRLKAAQSYNASMAERSAQYDAMYEDALFAEAQTNAIVSIKNNIDSYPLPYSAVDNVIKAAAEGYVTVAVKGYAAESGTIKMAATAAEVEKINIFIERLRDQETFRQVDYTGYTFDDKTNLWNVNVTCTLAEIAGKEAN